MCIKAATWSCWWLFWHLSRWMKTRDVLSDSIALWEGSLRTEIAFENVSSCFVHATGERVGCGLHRGTSQPESPRARKLWEQGGMTGSPLRCKTLFPPFLCCVSSWSLFSNSIGKGFLEDQSTYIWSVSVRAIFSKRHFLMYLLLECPGRGKVKNPSPKWKPDTKWKRYTLCGF